MLGNVPTEHNMALSWGSASSALPMCSTGTSVLMAQLVNLKVVQAQLESIEIIEGTAERPRTPG